MWNSKHWAICCSLFVLFASTGAPAQSEQQCQELFALEVPRVDLHITNATHLAANAGSGRALPAHCRLDGEIDQRNGKDGKPYAIGFALALPKRWNGRFLLQGGGGQNGSVRPPLGAQAAGDASALARGFAVASTDSDHRGAAFDSGFYDDQQAAIDFLYGAVAKVTKVAKRIIARHYGNPAGDSYFVGCSTGGREAMMMSQRYPMFYDGIVAGDPEDAASFECC